MLSRIRITLERCTRLLFLKFPLSETIQEVLFAAVEVLVGIGIQFPECSILDYKVTNALPESDPAYPVLVSNSLGTTSGQMRQLQVLSHLGPLRMTGQIADPGRCCALVSRLTGYPPNFLVGGQPCIFERQDQALAWFWHCWNFSLDAPNLP